jgi:replicative DNA helicase
VKKRAGDEQVEWLRMQDWDGLSPCLKKKYYYLDRCHGVPYEPVQHTVSPLLIGWWLGDGTVNSSSLCVGAKSTEMIAAVEAEVGRHPGLEYRSRKDPKMIGVPGLLTRLRAIGVAGHKHIPIEYARDSLENRGKLLGGLLDTDGHNDGTSLVFTMCNPSLTVDITRLARSMGFGATLRCQTASRTGAAAARGNHDIVHKQVLRIFGDLSSVCPCLARPLRHPSGKPRM